ncbi:RidA family protein [Antarcticimicrobium luteum]|uniref:RidA family protein n=1 Tax=Antarcticimicrobium luteum TaxID=2547397 RepID=A0A4R5V1N1_9RHOB|nr:RidA family protein [Antarcticimicrobium luteum]TDK45649.1 RidA family protein [Antarcticimicrobium luteum]
MTKITTNPDHPAFKSPDGSSIFDKFGYSAAVRAGDFVYAAGQIGLNPDGSIPESDSEQIRNAFDRLKIVLEAAGSSMDDVVELITYHVGIKNNLAGCVAIKADYIKAPFPTWTIIEVAGLARPELKIEIKATAYTPEK